MAHLVINKAILKLSPDMAMLFHPPFLLIQNLLPRTEMFFFFFFSLDRPRVLTIESLLMSGYV